MANKDVLKITFDANAGIKELEQNLIGSMNGMSEEISKKLEEAFAKAGRNPKLKKQLTGIYQGLFDEFGSAAGDLKEIENAVDRFAGKIDYLNKVANKSGNKGLLDNLSIENINKVLRDYDKLIEKQNEINRLQSNEFRDNKRSETTIKSLKELERTYGDVGKAKEKYEDKVNDYLKNVGVETSAISKEIKEYSSLIALFDKISSTKAANGSDEAIKKSQALLYVMQKITDLENGNTLFSNFRLNELDIKSITSSLTVLTQEVEGSITSLVNGMKRNLNKQISEIFENAVAEAEKMSQHQFKVDVKTQAKITNKHGNETGTGGESGDGVPSDFTDKSDGLDVWVESAKELENEFRDVIKYASDAEVALARINEIWDKYANGKGTLLEGETDEMFALMKRLDSLVQNKVINKSPLSKDQLEEFEAWKDEDDYKKVFDRIDQLTSKQIARIKELKATQKDVGDGSGSVGDVGNIDNSKVEELSKEIAEVKEDIVSLKGRVDTLEDTTAFDTLSSQVSEFGEQIKNADDTLSHMKKTINKLVGSKSLGQVIKDISEHGRNNEGSGEILAYSSSSTGYTSDIDISDSATGITKEFREEVYNRVKAEAEAIDTQIHSHPDNEIAAASYDDIGVMIRQLEEGITKQAVTSLSQVMTFDFDSTSFSKDELKSKLLSVFEEYKKWVFKYFSPIDENGKLHELAPLTDEMEKNIVEYAKKLLKIFPDMDEDLLDSDVTQMLFQDKIKELFSKNGLGDVVKLSNLVDIESSFSFSDIRNVADPEFLALTSQMKNAVEKGYAEAQDSHSPSKEAEKLNDDFVAGVAESANKNTGKLTDIGKQMADNIKDGFKEGMSDIDTAALSQENQSTVLLGDQSSVLSGNQTEVLLPDTTTVIQEQNKVQEELQETRQEAENTAEAIISVYRGLKSSTDDMFDSDNQSAWFSSNIESARSFGRYTDDNIYKANIKLNNPMVVDAMGASHDGILYAETAEELEEIIKLQDELNKKQEEFNLKYGKYIETQDKSYIDDVSAYLKTSDELFALMDQLQSSKKTTEELQSIAKSKGHDGLIIKNVRDNFLDTSSDLGTSYAVFNKESILCTELLNKQEVQALATAQAEIDLATAQKEASQVNETPLSLVEESSGQLAMFEGVEEQQKEVKTAVEKTNNAIEGQIDLFEYLSKQEAKSSKPIKDTFDADTSTASTGQHTSDIKAETNAIEENTQALKENAQVQKKQSETKEDISDTRIHDVNKAWTAAVRENKVFDENKTRLAIKNYEELIGKLDEYYALLAKEHKGQLTSDETDSLNKFRDQINKASKSIDEFKGKEKDLKDVVKKFNTRISEFDKDSGLIGRNERNDIFESLSQDDIISTKTDKYETKLKDLENIILEIRKLVPIDVNSEEDRKELNRLNAEFDKLANNLSSNEYNPAKQIGIDALSGKIFDTLHKNTAAPKEIRMQLEGLIAKLKEFGLSEADIQKVREEFVKLNSQMKATGKTGDSLGTKIKKKFKDVAAYFSTYVSIQDAIQVIRQGFETIKEYDKALTEMNKVSDESISTLKEYQQESFKTADAIGTTASSLQNSTADWQRLGEAFEEAQQSAQDANILFNVSEFESIDEATESLVSMSQAYKELEKGEIIDVVNNLGLFKPKHTVMYGDMLYISW